MSKTFVIDTFIGVNDNSAKEYNQSLIEYLLAILEQGDWHAMSDHQLYLNGGKKMLTELIEELNTVFDVEE